MSQEKYKWNEYDTKIICLCYLLKPNNPEYALIMLPHIKLSSIKMKYHNCKFLQNENQNGLSNVSKLHRTIWDMLI